VQQAPADEAAAVLDRTRLRHDVSRITGSTGALALWSGLLLSAFTHRAFGAR